MIDYMARLEARELKINKGKLRRDLAAVVFVIICIGLFVIIGDIFR